MIRRSMTAAMLLCFGLMGMAAAQDTPASQPAATLNPGDPAPALAQGKYLKGDPITAFEPGKMYVVEFWATWCGPCKEAIPHVTEMQGKYKDQGVTFIGQDVWENDPTQAAPFVQQMGDQMNYRVALDDVSDGGKGKMAVTWMDAAGQDSIPTSFLIDKTGKIAWIGHPMELEPILKQVLAGTFDIKKEAARQIAIKAVQQKFMAAMQASNFDDALKALDEYQTMSPDMSTQLDAVRFGIQLQKKDYDTAYKTAAKVLDDKDADPNMLNALAWTIVDQDGVEKRDYDLAEKLAVKANDMTQGKDPGVLDTLARVYFEKKDVDKAIDLETKAVDLADAEQKPQLQDTLTKYKAAKK